MTEIKGLLASGTFPRHWRRLACLVTESYLQRETNVMALNTDARYFRYRNGSFCSRKGKDFGGLRREVVETFIDLVERYVPFAEEPISLVGFAARLREMQKTTVLAQYTIAPWPTAPLERLLPVCRFTHPESVAVITKACTLFDEFLRHLHGEAKVVVLYTNRSHVYRVWNTKGHPTELAGRMHGNQADSEPRTNKKRREHTHSHLPGQCALMSLQDYTAHFNEPASPAMLQHFAGIESEETKALNEGIEQLDEFTRAYEKVNGEPAPENFETLAYAFLQFYVSAPDWKRQVISWIRTQGPEWGIKIHQTARYLTLAEPLRRLWHYILEFIEFLTGERVLHIVVVKRNSYETRSYKNPRYYHYSYGKNGESFDEFQGKGFTPADFEDLPAPSRYRLATDEELTEMQAEYDK